MRADEAKLAATLKPGDRVTTTLGNECVVGSIHPDAARAGHWWIEPTGADDFDWWLPVGNVIAVNGMPTPEILD